MNSIATYLAKIVKAQLNNTIPESLPGDISVKQIVQIAVQNQMTYLLLSGLIKTSISDTEKEMLRPLIKQSLQRTLAQNIEIQKLKKVLEEEKIVNQFMKGTELKNLYPQPAFREMNDIDIRITNDSREKVRSVLEQKGYTLTKKIFHHDVYEKGSLIELEMHHMMFDQTLDQKQHHYFSDFSKTLLNDGCDYSYHFTNEDFYIYMMAHMAKHFYVKGCGIRNLVDIYVYREHFKHELDEVYIEQELKKCGILTFVKHMEKLTDIWLKGEKSTPFYDDVFSYMLDSGIYGKPENGLWNEFAKNKVEGNYAFHLKKISLFPPMHYMMRYYPWIREKKLRLAGAWIIRIIKGFLNGKVFKREEIVNKTEQQQIMKLLQIYKKMDFQFK